MRLYACGSNLYSQIQRDAHVLDIVEPVEIPFSEGELLGVHSVSASQIITRHLVDGRVVYQTSGYPLSPEQQNDDGIGTIAEGLITDTATLFGRSVFSAGLTTLPDKSDGPASQAKHIFRIGERATVDQQTYGHIPPIADMSVDGHGRVLIALRNSLELRLYDTLDSLEKIPGTYAVLSLVDPPPFLRSAQPSTEIKIFSGAAHFIIAYTYKEPSTLRVQDTTVFAWGDNRYFQLGHHMQPKGHLRSDGKRQNAAHLVHPVTIFDGLPTHPSLGAFKNIACGDLHTAFVTSDGSLYMAGSDRHGQCGGFTATEPVLVSLAEDDTDTNVLDVACGRNHTVVNTDRGVYVAGKNHCGQLGQGDRNNRAQFTKVCFFQGKQVQAVHAAGWVSLFLLD